MSWSDWFTDILGPIEGVRANLALTLVIIVILGLLRWLVLRLVYRRWENARIRYHIRKLVTYFTVGMGLLALGLLVRFDFSGLGTVIGLASAGVAIALKDLVAGLAGRLYLISRRPFEVGDRIQIGPHSGDVIDIRLFRFSLMEIGNWVEADQSTGRVIHIPNGFVLTEMIANYSKGFKYIWNEIAVLVTFESDWKKAKAILQAIADKHSADLSESAAESLRRASEKAMLFYSILTPKVWTRVADSGVCLTVRYLCEPRMRRSTEEVIWEEVLNRFANHADIEFAYPTVRRFLNPDEGKPGTGGPSREGSPLGPGGDSTA